MLQKALQVLPVWRQRTIGRNTSIRLETTSEPDVIRISTWKRKRRQMPTETHQLG